MGRAPLLVGVHHIDSDTATTDSGNQRAQGGRGAPAATDHLAEIVGMDVYLDGPSTPAGHQVDSDIVGVVDNAAHQMFDGVDDDGTHAQLSVAGSACSLPSADGAAAASASADGVAGASASAAFSASSAFSALSDAAAFLAGAFFFFGVAA
jgi:hypothetical protein